MTGIKSPPQWRRLNLEGLSATILVAGEGRFAPQGERRTLTEPPRSDATCFPCRQVTTAHARRCWHWEQGPSSWTPPGLWPEVGDEGHSSPGRSNCSAPIWWSDSNGTRPGAILWPLRRDSRVQTFGLTVSRCAVERLKRPRIALRREGLADDSCDAQPGVAWPGETAVCESERMATGALVATPQDRDGFSRDLGVVEEVEHLAQTCIVRSPLLGVEGVAWLRFRKPRWNLANQREASTLCDAARQSAIGAGGTAE